MKSICVYCGSKPGNDPQFTALALEMGHYLAQSGLRLVYGGGHSGLMGAMADACISAGGQVLGVIPQKLVEAERAHQGITELVVVANMHERKERMSREADGFIAMPGGIGTMEELFEAFTWHQLGITDKPVGLLNCQGYYDGLLGFLQRMVDEAFLPEGHRDILLVDTEVASLVSRMENYQRKHVLKWN